MTGMVRGSMFTTVINMAVRINYHCAPACLAYLWTSSLVLLGRDTLTGRIWCLGNDVFVCTKCMYRSRVYQLQPSRNRSTAYKPLRIEKHVFTVRKNRSMYLQFRKIHCLRASVGITVPHTTKQVPFKNSLHCTTCFPKKIEGRTLRQGHWPPATLSYIHCN